MTRSELKAVLLIAVAVVGWCTYLAQPTRRNLESALRGTLPML